MKFKKIKNKYLCFVINSRRIPSDGDLIKIYDRILDVYDDEPINLYFTTRDIIMDTDICTYWHYRKLGYAQYLLDIHYDNILNTIKDVKTYELDISKKKWTQSLLDKIEYEYKTILNQILDLEPILLQSDFYIAYLSNKDNSSLLQGVFQMYTFLLRIKLRKIKMKTIIKIRFDKSEYELKKEIIGMLSFLEELFKKNMNFLIQIIEYKILRFYIEYLEDKKTALKEFKNLIDKYNINFNDISDSRQLQHLFNEIK